MSDGAGGGSPPQGTTWGGKARRWALPGILLLAVLVRLPFWRIALETPVDGDTAIVGLMVRGGAAARTFWGQPYGSPLDAWLAWPFVALLGSTTAAVRLPYFLLSMALVPIAYAIARRLSSAAALPAALLAACPPAYVLLLSALPPPLYPPTLALLGLLLWGTLALEEKLAAGQYRPAMLVLGATAWGAGAGLALWSHLASAATLVPCALYLWQGSRRRRILLGAALPAFLLASAPLGLCRWADASATLSIVRMSGDGEPLLLHARELLPPMHQPLLGLLGARTPITAGDPDRVVQLDASVSIPLVLLYVTALGAAVHASRRALRGRLLCVAALLPVLCFPFPVRSGPEAVRFLTPAFLPLCALAAWGVAERSRARAWVLVTCISAGQLLLTRDLLHEWRLAGPALVPSCHPIVDLLQSEGVTRAWASYDVAWCVTYTSGEHIVASQPWNERFPGYDLPLRRAVAASRGAAWVLAPGRDFDLPSPRAFERWLEASGGSAHRIEVEDGVLVYDDFQTPFPACVESPAGRGPALDGDLSTRVVEPPRGSVVFAFAPIRASGVTLVGSVEPPGLPRGFRLQASSDGEHFETVARFREGHADLVWLNGHPQLRPAELVSVPFAERVLTAVRITPVPARGPWGIREVLVHPADGCVSHGARAVGWYWRRLEVSRGS